MLCLCPSTPRSKDIVFANGHISKKEIIVLCVWVGYVFDASSSCMLFYCSISYFLFLCCSCIASKRFSRRSAVNDVKPSRLGDDHLGAERVELAPKIAVVQCNFDVLVRTLIDARRHSWSGRRRQHVASHARCHGARVVAATERTALTCIYQTVLWPYSFTTILVHIAYFIHHTGVEAYLL